MAELTLWQDVALKVRDLQVRFDAFETENAELRHNLNSVIDTVNNITRIWNEAIGDDDEQSTIDNEVLPEAVGEQSMEDNEVLPEAVGEQSMEDNEVLTLPQDEHPQLTLEEVYNKYQSQPQTEEEWEEMNKAIKKLLWRTKTVYLIEPKYVWLKLIGQAVLRNNCI